MWNSCLLMPLWAPMQSWGDMVLTGDNRPTLSFPTHSGLCGMIAAALGIERDRIDPLKQVHSSLDFLTLTCCKGRMETDFYAVNGVVRAEGLKVRPDDTFIGRKTYMADTVFLVAAFLKEESDSLNLKKIGEALLNPHFPIFAGRKSYPFSISPVIHRNEKPILYQWENPFQEMLNLWVLEKSRKEIPAFVEKEPSIFGKTALPNFASKPVFHCGESLLDQFSNRELLPDFYIEKEKLVPYQIRDRFIPGTLKTRRFETRNVYKVVIPEEHVSI